MQPRKGKRRNYTNKCSKKKKKTYPVASGSYSD